MDFVQIGFTLIACIGVPMGFYQLSTKIYSNKGYPNYLFIIMYILGIIGFLCNII